MSDNAEVTKVEMASQAVDSEVGYQKELNTDDNILLAQGHQPVLKRTFNLLGTLGLGFRYVQTTAIISSSIAVFC